MRPIVIVNCKTYPQATGERAVTLAQHCERAAKEFGYDIRIAVQPTDIYRVAQAVRIPVYAQHGDAVGEGKNTGFVTAAAIKQAGGSGALLNHSEHRLSNEDILVTAKLLQRSKLDAIVLAETPRKIALLAKHLTPTFFCVEPPELIAGDVSVSHAQPDLVKHAVQATSIPVLVGAGVKTYEDLEIALELRAAGILVSSGIVLAPHKERALRRLLKPHAR